jgi:hypothetical protein
LAKFGYLYLNGGRWDGNQLIPADYVAAATSQTGSTPNVSMGYGWLWWVATEGGHRTFSARPRRSDYLRRPRPGPGNRHHQRPRERRPQPPNPDHADHSPGRHQLTARQTAADSDAAVRLGRQWGPAIAKALRGGRTGPLGATTAPGGGARCAAEPIWSGNMECDVGRGALVEADGVLRVLGDGAAADSCHAVRAVSAVPRIFFA